MQPKISPGLPSLRSGESFSYDDKKADQFGSILKHDLAPSLKLHLDKDVYRPGDMVVATIEIHNPENEKKSISEHAGDDVCLVLIENLTFEIKGMERLDVQWYATHKPSRGSKQKRGEKVFLDSTTISIISKVIISSECNKAYMVRTELPKVLPPSYRGTAIRYIYYVRSSLCGRWLQVENGHSNRKSVKDPIQLEARTPLHIWVTPETSGLLTEEGQSDGILPAAALQMVIYWKERDADSEWARTNETSDGVEDDYDSSRDEISSVASHSHTKENLDLAFGDSLSLQSSSFNPRYSVKGTSYPQREHTSFPLHISVPQPSISGVSYDATGDEISPVGSSVVKNFSQKKLGSYSSTLHSPSQRKSFSKSYLANDEMGGISAPGIFEPITSEGFIRGRSYNIRMDDQILLRFSPKNSDSTYYFGDMIGGTLTFFHEGRARRCLEVSITLETSETISEAFLHPSRRNSPSNIKIQSDHHEVVADLLQSSFLFSIPTDGPMSFSTSHVSVQWALHFEFFTTPKNMDWTRYDHPLLVEGREKGEWILPITVHAPLPRTQTVHKNRERPLSPGSLWVRP